MASNINSVFKFPYKYPHQELASQDNWEIYKNLSWDGTELSAEEVDSFFLSLDKEDLNPSRPSVENITSVARRFFTVFPANPRDGLKKPKRAFTQQDVETCEYAVKQYNLIRKDGLLDLEGLSAHTGRAVTSLRYNIYLAKNSVFAGNPFFASFRKEYIKRLYFKPLSKDK